MVLVAAAAADDFSSVEIRFDERYFFRHPLRRRRRLLTTIPTDVLFSLSIFPLSSLFSSYMLIDHCAHEYIYINMSRLPV